MAGQSVTITGTVKDPVSGLPYQNATGRAVLISGNGQTTVFTIGGTNPVRSPIWVNLDSFGNFSVELVNTCLVDQQFAQPVWQFGWVSAPYMNVGRVAFDGPALALCDDQDITAQITAVPPAPLPVGEGLVGPGGTGGTIPINSLLSATGPNDITNLNFTQAWRWLLTGTNPEDGLFIAEPNGMASSNTGALSALVGIGTHAGSTISPFRAIAHSGPGLMVTPAGDIQAVNGASFITNIIGPQCLQVDANGVIIGTGSPCGSGGVGGGGAFNALTNATGPNDISNNSFQQTWRWELTGSTPMDGVLFDEPNGIASSNTGALSALVGIGTHIGSTIAPLRAIAHSGPGLMVTPNGDIQAMLGATFIGPVRVPALANQQLVGADTSGNLTPCTLVAGAGITITPQAGGIILISATAAPPAQVTVAGLSISPAPVLGSNSTTGYVTLTGPAPTGGATVTLTTTNFDIASVPSSVTIAAGAASATFTITTSGVVVDVPVTITAAYGGATANYSLTVLAPATPTLVSITLNPTSVQGGSTSTATVTLSGPSGGSGAVVTLGTSNATATPGMATEMIILPGATTGAFPVPTASVASNTTATISATFGNTVTAVLSVTAAAPVVGIASIVLNPSSVAGGGSSTATVTLTAPAGGGDAYINLSSSNIGVATVPTALVILGGLTTGTFTVSTFAITTANSSVITASLSGGNSQTATLTVTPAVVPTLISMTANPASATAGQTVTVTATLSDPAPLGGAVVALSYANYDQTQFFPVSLTVPAGQTSGATTLNIGTVSSPVTLFVEGIYGVPVGLNIPLTPAPATLTSLVLNPASLVGGANAIATLTFATAAPVGTVINVSSSNTSVAQLQLPTITVSSATTTMQFTVFTSAVTTVQTVTITASNPTLGTQTANLTVNPPLVAPTITAFTLSPNPVVGGNAVTGTVTITPAAPAGGTIINLGSTDATHAPIPGLTFTIAAGQTSGTFTILTTTASSQVTPTITVSATGGSSQQQVLTITPVASGNIYAGSGPAGATGIQYYGGLPALTPSQTQLNLISTSPEVAGIAGVGTQWTFTSPGGNNAYFLLFGGNHTFVDPSNNPAPMVSPPVQVTWNAQTMYLYQSTQGFFASVTIRVAT